MAEKSKWLLPLVALSALGLTVGLNISHEISSGDRLAKTIDVDNGDLKINWSRFESFEVALSDNLEIVKSGVYHLTGSLSNSGITINVPDGKVKLILDNVTIENPTGPAIACYAADDLVIELVGESDLSDGKTYATSYDEDVKGAIYSKDDLTFEGDGTLNLTASYQDGIVGKDDLKFNSGNYNIIAADDGIRGKDSVYIVDGNFTINAKGDGIKSDNENKAGKGFILIKKGTINITAGDDGIHAYNRLIINDGKINIAKSYEGLEAQNIYIAGGDISIFSLDDGINAGGGSDSSNAGGAFASNSNCILEIAGGSIYINASGDGVDSNGYIHFNGGTVIVDGPTNNGNGALDAGISVSQTGGTVIAIGASGMAETLGSTSSVYNASIYFTSSQSAGTEIKIKNEDGETIAEHTSAKTFNHMAVGITDFKEGETYTIYLDNKKYDTFTISSITTTVGSNSNGNMNGGDMTPPEMNDNNGGMMPAPSKR